MKYCILGLLLVPLFTLSGLASGQESSALFLKSQGGQSAEIRVYEAN
jgi:hypothetical protein